MEDNKYLREITASASGGQTIKVDVYDVLKAFPTGCPAIDHAVKKLLCAGMRGHKDRRQDLQEAMTSIRRAIELMSPGEFRAELPQTEASEDEFKVGDAVYVAGAYGFDCHQLYLVYALNGECVSIVHPDPKSNKIHVLHRSYLCKAKDESKSPDEIEVGDMVRIKPDVVKLYSWLDSRFVFCVDSVQSGMAVMCQVKHDSIRLYTHVSNLIKVKD